MYIHIYIYTYIHIYTYLNKRHMQDAQGRLLRPRAETDGKQKEEEGFEWNELPAIGDLVWARLPESKKQVTHTHT